MKSRFGFLRRGRKSPLPANHSGDTSTTSRQDPFRSTESNSQDPAFATAQELLSTESLPRETTRTSAPGHTSHEHHTNKNVNMHARDLGIAASDGITLFLKFAREASTNVPILNNVVASMVWIIDNARVSIIRCCCLFG